MDNRVSILDCTLRDGGYINDWMFGNQEIRSIIKNLIDSKVDIVECGFLRPENYNLDSSVFSSDEQIAEIIKPKVGDTLYVAMVEYHNYQDGLICPKDKGSIDGIRLTFRKKEWRGAKEVAMKLIGLGYKVFIQPVGSCTYSDNELLTLIQEVNQLRPFAFYLVDTLGMLYQKDVQHFFQLINQSLAKDIYLGFHSHNNLQLSFANAQEIIRLSAGVRNIIIDSSVYGMGRGVGNLATELLADYINNNIEQRYSLNPLLNIADQYLMPIYARQRWGYDLPYFLSATAKCHPNYAAHLMKKQTLNIETIEKLLNLIPTNKRSEYDRELIESMYTNLLSYNVDDRNSMVFAKTLFGGKNVLVLGPGSSIANCSAEIKRVITVERAVVVTVNFVSKDYQTAIPFISNAKRLSMLSEMPDVVLGTSNLLGQLPQTAIIFNYSSLLGEGDAADNAASMLIRLLKICGAKKVLLAGLDGFNANTNGNYYIGSYERAIDSASAKKKNNEIARQLKLSLVGIDYKFITPTKYEL